MYQGTLETFTKTAADKVVFLRNNPVGFFISAMMAGAYIGIGIVVIFSVGHLADPAWRSIVMGASFGIALTLVVFAGAELFTGHVMYMTIGLLRGSVSFRDLLASWIMSWSGNLVGAVILSVLIVVGGASVATSGFEFIDKVATYKMNSPAIELVMRAMLCNWLVCLALWMSARTQNDVAKCILIFWCLFAFIASGFEHSVANMTVFGVSALAGGMENLNLAGIGHNLLWVTVGNILSGALFLGLGYWLADGSPRETKASGEAVAGETSQP